MSYHDIRLRSHLFSTLSGDGEAYTTGANSEKQLGVKGVECALSPVRVSGLDAHTVHCIACGESHMLAVIDNGGLAAWGSNEYGQLGESPGC